MTYLELVIVVAIFGMMSAVALFNYKNFQSKVDIKNLANDIALKVVEAQKNSISGKWNSQASAGWKPSYGIYFNLNNGVNTSNIGPKFFYSFVDLGTRDQLFDFGSFSCPNNECLSKTTITKGSYVYEIRIVYIDNSFTIVPNDLHITFIRPNSGATIRSSTPLNPNISYAQVTVSAVDNVTKATIKFYASGRVQIN